jgi:hypothetical protein
MHPLMEWTRRPEYMIRRVLRYWLRNPTSPLAISSALWFSESGPGSSTINATIHPPRDLSFPPESFSIEPSRASLEERIRTTPLMDFRSLQHIPATRIHLRRPCHDPATGRLQGLVTLLTGFAPRRLAGLVSSRQRSWDSPLRSVPLSEGDRRVSTTIGPA